MSNNIKIPKKLIEVALPLDDINEAAAKEKQPFTRNHPRSLHLWWARRPLSAARAILFAQLVNDPGGERGWTNTKTKAQASREREELFNIIRELVKWENTDNEKILTKARIAIKKSWEETCKLNMGKPGFDPKNIPAFHDPFAGGGTIPLEAQRLGLESYASDLNPVSVMINKAMIEIPPKFADHKPIGPLISDQKQIGLMEDWKGLRGIADDVRRYGHWVWEKAYKKIGNLYPTAKVTNEIVKKRPDLKEYIGKDLPVIAWLWTRTVKCPNPACGCEMPLLSSLVLSKKKGKEIYIHPIPNKNLKFDVKLEKPDIVPDANKGFKRGTSGIFECYKCGSTTTRNYTAEQANKFGLGSAQTAIVCEGNRCKIYLPPDASIVPKNLPKINTTGLNIELSPNPRDVWCRNFGLKTPADLFTPRQLVALSTFFDLIKEVRSKVITDALYKGMPDDDIGIDKGGRGATAYGDAIAVYLAEATSRWADMSNSLCSWNSSNQNVRALFSRQTIPMCWDFVELSPFSKVGPWVSCVESIFQLFQNLNYQQNGIAVQKDAANQNLSQGKIISTDPPYYDNIGYADLSDFFYVWLRRSLKEIYPDLFTTMAVPKIEELVAIPYRHDNKEDAEKFFMTGMTNVIKNLSQTANPAFPVTIYYAFKQSETKNNTTSSSGWESFLEAVIRAGFSIVGTWPVRTERRERSVSLGTNALASSIVLVCKKRRINSNSVSRRQFQRELRDKMPEALESMIGGSEGISPIAPVDLAQAAIGPGMAIFSSYKAVLNQDGSEMSVHDALILINRSITEYLNPDSGDFDADTLFCDDWFAQNGWGEGLFGEANVLAQAKGTTVDGVADAGVAVSGGGKVRLLKWNEYPTDWDPQKDKRTPIWEACHQMIRVLNQQGETKAGGLLAKMPEKGEAIRQLAYHLYTQCERKKWAEEARAYNELIGSWHAIVSASQEIETPGKASQLELEF